MFNQLFATYKGKYDHTYCYQKCQQSHKYSACLSFNHTRGGLMLEKYDILSLRLE
jgi:hypothetical protein